MAGEVPVDTKGFQLSLDTWAVILALLLALVVRAGVVKIPW